MMVRLKIADIRLKKSEKAGLLARAHRLLCCSKKPGLNPAAIY
jgi:hypothetical protein